MEDLHRYPSYKDLSEGVGRRGPAEPPITKKKITKQQAVGKRPIRRRHGILCGPQNPCHRPMAETVQDVKKTGIRGIVGGRWLLGRANKTTSPVVIFLVPGLFSGAGWSARYTGQRTLEAYDFNRGRIGLFSQFHYVGGIQMYVVIGCTLVVLRA